jgi:hypothetical protein
MKWLIGIILALVIVIVLAALALFVYIDYAAKIGIERGATYALGVPTTLGSADVGVFSGEFDMTGLNVANPQGFDTPHFLALADGAVAVSLGTLRQETVELPKLHLTGLDMYLEKKDGRNNYDVILDNLKRLESGEKPKDETGEGKDFVIREVLIKDVDVHVDVLPIGGELSRVEVPIDEIRLTDVGTGDQNGVKFTELADVILKALFAAVIENGADLPGEMLHELQNGLAGLQSLGDMGINAASIIDGQVQELAGTIGKGAEELGKGLGEAAGGLGDLGKQADEGLKGLGNLLGGEKDKDKDKEKNKDE